MDFKPRGIANIFSNAGKEIFGFALLDIIDLEEDCFAMENSLLRL
jgi:hypothetical protein